MAWRGRMRAFPGEHATRVAGQSKLARWQKAATAPGPKGPKAWEAANKIVDTAFRADFLTFSTNFLARRNESATGLARVGNKSGRPWRRTTTLLAAMMPHTSDALPWAPRHPTHSF